MPHLIDQYPLEVQLGLLDHTLRFRHLAQDLEGDVNAISYFDQSHLVEVDKRLPGLGLFLTCLDDSCLVRLEDYLDFELFL